MSLLKYPVQTVSPIMSSFIPIMFQPLSKLSIKLSFINATNCVTAINPKRLAYMIDPTNNKNRKEAAMLLLHDNSFHLQITASTNRTYYRASWLAIFRVCASFDMVTVYQYTYKLFLFFSDYTYG